MEESKRTLFSRFFGQGKEDNEDEDSGDDIIPRLKVPKTSISVNESTFCSKGCSNKCLKQFNGLNEEKKNAFRIFLLGTLKSRT